ncbi:MAG: hypothetical protein LBG19_11140 [Prevotellaceae bacterium]|nr:hypothetical protein [Prevotellaceae bacterium]
MPFINKIWKYSSLSIVGLEKNTGKTECLNYILNRVKNSEKVVALTSIGIDGEGIDQVTHTHKPEIEVFEGMLFATSEKHYKGKLLTAEILDITRKRTSLGRLIIARASSSGKVLLSGPADTAWLRSLIAEFRRLGANLTLVDGALSRLSLASPATTDAMVLATGAALSANIPELVRRTTFIYTLINLPQVEDCIKSKINSIDKGVWAIDNNNELHDLNISSAFSINTENVSLLSYRTRLFIAGAVSDKLINFLRIQKQIKDIEVIVKDFSKLFISPEAYNMFTRKGGRIKVLQQPELLAICINPVAPNGQQLNSQELIEALQANVSVPVYDVRQLEQSYN